MVWNKRNCLYNWMSFDFLKEEKIINSALENKSICDGNIGTHLSWGRSSDWWLISLQRHKELQLCVSAAETPLSPSCLCLSMFFFHSWDEKMNDSVITVDVSWWEETKTSKVQVFVRRSGRPWTESSVCHFHISLWSWIKSPHTSRAAAFELKINYNKGRKNLRQCFGKHPASSQCPKKCPILLHWTTTGRLHWPLTS